AANESEQTDRPDHKDAIATRPSSNPARISMVLVYEREKPRDMTFFRGSEQNRWNEIQSGSRPGMFISGGNASGTLKWKGTLNVPKLDTPVFSGTGSFPNRWVLRLEADGDVLEQSWSGADPRVVTPYGCKDDYCSGARVSLSTSFVTAMLTPASSMLVDSFIIALYRVDGGSSNESTIFRRSYASLELRTRLATLIGFITQARKKGCYGSPVSELSRHGPDMAFNASAVADRE
ncbi:MAG: hypothetical protein AAFX94_15790, partial [Myxococcota bacterium]